MPAVTRGETVAFANQKGGVGKTTTVVNLAAYLALSGRSIAVVDLDPQGNATSGLGIDRAGHSLYEVFVGHAGILEVARPTAVANLDLVPSSLALAGLEIELVAVQQRERRLRVALEPLKQRYDFIFIDCPPSLGLLTVNALTAADSVLVPVQTEYYALEGLGQLMATVDLVRDHLNPGLAILGALLTMHDPRTRLAADVSADVRRSLRDRVFRTVIPRSVRLSEAPSFGQPICLYRPDSKGADAYARLADEFAARVGARSAERRLAVPA